MAGAEPFTEVLAAHKVWMDEHGLNHGNALFVTCGDWDLKTMLPAQCRAAGVPHGDLPVIYQQWMNIKETFVGVTGEKAGGMSSMLKRLGLPLEGRHHRGIDDCRNIARLLIALQARGAKLVASTPAQS